MSHQRWRLAILWPWRWEHQGVSPFEKSVRLSMNLAKPAALQGFMKSGTETVLKGHTKRVGCLMTHQHVLLSGASDGSVRCWQMNVHTQTFECILAQSLTHAPTERESCFTKALMQ